VLTVMKSRWRDLSPIQFSCNCNYSLITHNKTPVHSTWGLLRVCAACQTVRLNLSSELRPSGNNIQDTFATGSAQDTTKTRVIYKCAFGMNTEEVFEEHTLVTNTRSFMSAKCQSIHSFHICFLASRR